MNLYKNYYKILKIDKSASDKQVKDAYLKLAKIYHPDKNPLQESVVLFQEIKEAHDVLTKQRKEYDTNSPHFVKKPSLDLEINIEAKQLQQVITYQAWRNCKKCDHTGFDISQDYHNCQRCRGKGEDDDGFECKKCLGTGKAYDSLCKNCKGQKQILQSLRVQLPNVKKDTYVMPLQGNQSLRTGHIGTLTINVTWQ